MDCKGRIGEEGLDTVGLASEEEEEEEVPREHWSKKEKRGLGLSDSQMAEREEETKSSSSSEEGEKIRGSALPPTVCSSCSYTKGCVDSL